ncbi:hypothetical protein MG296_10520 [Flavobacteriaceae bacterium TK19130]|nr:hypothetical protein [Thermobacterium salinum]
MKALKILRIISYLLIIGLIIAFFLMASSCGISKEASKTKTEIDKTEISEKKTNTETDSVTTNVTTETVDEKKKIELSEETDVAEIEADSTGTVGIEKIATETGTKIIYSGVSSLKLSNTKKEMQETFERQQKRFDSLSVVFSSYQSETENTLSNLRQSIKEKAKQKKEDFKSGTILYFFIGIGLLLFIAIMVMRVWIKKNSAGLIK